MPLLVEISKELSLLRECYKWSVPSKVLCGNFWKSLDFWLPSLTFDSPSLTLEQYNVKVWNLRSDSRIVWRYFFRFKDVLLIICVLKYYAGKSESGKFSGKPSGSFPSLWKSQKNDHCSKDVMNKALLIKFCVAIFEKCFTFD